MKKKQAGLTVKTNLKSGKDPLGGANHNHSILRF
jgi:hypothetical protein